MAKKNNDQKNSGKETADKSPLVKLDETGRRAASDRRNQNAPVAEERRKTSRRRQIDPTTCERDYSEAEIEFMHALDDYKRRSGRTFPTCSEILEVLGELGYQKIDSLNNESFQDAVGEDEAHDEPVGISS